MELQLVDFETAKNLKEAGFNLMVRNYISTDGDRISPVRDGELYDFNRYDNCHSIPSLCLAAQWLREAKGLHAYADSSRDWSVWYTCVIVKDGSHDAGTEQHATHDAALSAGITQALTINKIK